MTTPGKTLRSDGAETRIRLKEEAQRLFALRGLDGVSVQDIISAAGQRNSASLRYYFGNKLELARELVVDGARLIDEDRQARLDRLEAEGGINVRAVLGALLFPMLGTIIGSWSVGRNEIDNTEISSGAAFWLTALLSLAYFVILYGGIITGSLVYEHSNWDLIMRSTGWFLGTFQALIMIALTKFFIENIHTEDAGPAPTRNDHAG